MYSLVKANALPNRSASQWVSPSLGDELVINLFLNYKKIILTLNLAGVEVFVDMEQLRDEYATYGNTLNVLLQVLSNRTLDTLASLPNQKVSYIKYGDMHRALYKTRLAKRGFILPENYPREALPDIALTRPDFDTDLSLIHTHALVSVNGFYHMTDTDGEVAYIVDGGISSRICNHNHFGLTSFLDIGAITKVKLDPSRITHRPNETLKDKIVFSIDEDLTNKSVILILGGVMVLPQENVFYQTGDKSFELDINQLPYLERLFEAKHYIDLAPLELTQSELSERLINLNEVYSDTVLKRYLTLSQSFLVIVDTPTLFSNKITIRQMQSPGIFSAYQDPTYPLIVGHGRLGEYWKVEEDGVWSVTVLDSYYRNYVHTLQARNTLENITDQLSCQQPYHYSQGVLLELGAYS